MLKPLPNFPALVPSWAPGCAVSAAKGRRSPEQPSSGAHGDGWGAELSCARRCPGSSWERAQLGSLCCGTARGRAGPCWSCRANHTSGSAGWLQEGKPRLSETAGCVSGRGWSSGPTEHCGNSSGAFIPTEQACSPKQTQTLTWTLYK